MIRLGDLDKTVSVRALLGTLDRGGILDGIPDLVQALLEHWTDDDGLHEAKFSDDLATSLSSLVEEAVAAAVEESEATGQTLYALPSLAIEPKVA